MKTIKQFLPLRAVGVLLAMVLGQTCGRMNGSKFSISPQFGKLIFGQRKRWWWTDSL